MAKGREGGRGGRGAVGDSKGPPREVLISKKLSWLLRHGAEKEGLKLGKGGYVNLEDVLRKMGALKPSLSEIREVVANNEKQRFSLIHITTSQLHDATTDLASIAPQSDEDRANDSDPKNYLIRANQGHSIKIDVEGLLTPITLDSSKLPTTVVHGTRHESWSKILQSGGLKPMTRNHVHFATGVPEKLKTNLSGAAVRDDNVEALPAEVKSATVISGMRNSSTILIFLDLRLALEKGLKFWMSENGVVLGEGNENGLIPVDLFRRVEDREGRLLVENGRVLAET